MFKAKKEIIVIQAEAETPIQTNVVFWSHDKGTAKLIFQLKKDGIHQSLTAGMIVPICLEFNSETAENGRGRHIYHALIEDAISGIVSIVLKDNILGYQGVVDGSIYIELPDTRSLDTAGRFTFEIKQSPIDSEVPELEDYYYEGFEEVSHQLTALKTDINEMSHRFDETTKEVIIELTETATQATTHIDDRATAVEKTISDRVTQANQTINGKLKEVETTVQEAEQKVQEASNEVIQVIEKNQVYTKNEADSHFVSTTEPQTIVGLKNFSEAPTVNESEVLTKEEIGGMVTLNMSVFYGEQGQLTGANVDSKEVFSGTQIFHLRPERPVAIRAENGRVKIQEEGVYLFIIHAWYQIGTQTNGYVYFNFFKNGKRAGNYDRIMGQGVDALKNRWDGTGQCVTTANAGDEYSVGIETSITGSFMSLGTKTITVIKLA